MGKLRILASGNSQQAQAQARGKLFEKLMAEVLRHYGYSIDRITNVNYAGMEIDIEGKHIVTGIPLYAECKCYETEIDSHKLQAFYGKYMAKWLKNKHSHGLFIALPGINSHAKGFYRENCELASEVTIHLSEEEQVLNAIFDTETIVGPDIISRLITQDLGIPGDWHLLYTDIGLYWAQYVIPIGGGIPNSIALFDDKGNSLSDKTTLDYLMKLYIELNDFKLVTVIGDTAFQTTTFQQDAEEIVEVNGSSACFEYQFPASPQHFVGRQSILQEVDAFTQAVIEKDTSSRGILFQADSGWGKSSVVLASVARLRSMGHFAVAIDSRSASSSQFILHVIGYVLSKFEELDNSPSEDNRPTTITGFDGAVKSLLRVGQALEYKGKLLFIFLDQFENIFFLPDTLKRIRDLLLSVCDVRTNVILGFSWKTDLIGSTSEFPYQLRDAIAGVSKHISLDTFSEVEITALLLKLSDELRAPLRKDLEFFLSEFSQGYPWLLKKLCAHVKSQREAGVPQSDIANSLLNVEELFQEDLRGLLPEEEDALRRIAKVAPISVLELGEEFKHEIVQSLVNARLIVRIGNKYDVYWDIFRDYLNSGLVPIQENYILRVQVGSVLKATKLLAEANGILRIPEFQKRADLTEKSFYNIMRYMRLLGLANIIDGNVRLQVNLPKKAEDFEDLWRTHLRDRLRHNRPVWQLLKRLEASGSLTLEEISEFLVKSSPYTSATDKTWQTYARTFADWMDTADLAIFDSSNRILKPMTEVREHRILPIKRRSGSVGLAIPSIQYQPIEKVAIRVAQALQRDNRVDWTGFKKSTISRALATLEDLGFIVINRKRKTQSIAILPKGQEFVSHPEKRPALFAEGALKMRSFATFIDILKTHQDTIRTLAQLAVEFKERLGGTWANDTAITYVKVMLDWARHTELAPGVFAFNRRGPTPGWKKEKNELQALLFSDEKQ